MCAQFAEAFDQYPPPPHCGHWTEAWCASTLACAQDRQELCFAYLDLPTYEDQPRFECTAEGYEGMYYVGRAQKVELEWAQNKMGLAVKPIKRMEMVTEKVAQVS